MTVHEASSDKGHSQFWSGAAALALDSCMFTAVQGRQAKFRLANSAKEQKTVEVHLSTTLGA